MFTNVYKCLQKHALSHAISLAVNYRLFSHGDVSYRFNGKNDSDLLECTANRANTVCCN